MQLRTGERTEALDSLPECEPRAELRPHDLGEVPHLIGQPFAQEPGPELNGERVAVHAGVFSDWFAPGAAESTLREFRLIRVRRVGYVAGVTPTGHLTIADHARHCATLLDELGVPAAHVCGHSSSALIGLQLALDRPEVVHSLVLFDPAPGGDLLGPINAPVIPNVVGPAMAAYAELGSLQRALELLI